MQLSVLIPTHARAEKLERCLRSLACQDNAPEFEVLVGVDGGSDDAQAMRIGVPAELRHRTRLIPFPKLGYIPVRGALLEQARAPLVLSLNDDVEASPVLLATHAGAHDGSARVVTGPAPFAPIDRPNLFDRLVAETGLIFFQPPASDGPFETDYRNCFGLNMSFPREAALELGGFPDLEDAYGYDDIEIAWRFARRLNAPIVHHPGAALTHHHRFTPADLLRREYALGRGAAAYAGVSPEFTMELFGEDIREPAYHDRIAAAVELEHRDAARLEAHVLGYEQAPYESASGPALDALAAGWVTLKRYLWRWGVLDGAHGRPHRWSLLRDLDGPPRF